jgi:hypothetical protein
MLCPRCHTAIVESVGSCPQCRQACEPVLQAEPVNARLIDEGWLIVLVLLHLGCLGIPLYLMTRYSLTTRLALVLVSILYTALVVVVTIAVGSYIWRQWQTL